jgi:hypothetical protein
MVISTSWRLTMFLKMCEILQTQAKELVFKI